MNDKVEPLTMHRSCAIVGAKRVREKQDKQTLYEHNRTNYSAQTA